MSLEVEGFEDHEERAKQDCKVLALPGWGCVRRLQEEVHAANAKDAPVVQTVFEYVRPRHRVVAKAVHEESLKLTFDIVENHKCGTNFLIECHWLGGAVDALTEQRQTQSDQERTCVFDEENSTPCDLGPEVFEVERDDVIAVLISEVIRQCLGFVFKAGAFGSADGEVEPRFMEGFLALQLYLLVVKLLEIGNCRVDWNWIGELHENFVVAVKHYNFDARHYI